MSTFFYERNRVTNACGIGDSNKQEGRKVVKGKECGMMRSVRTSKKVVQLGRKIGKEWLHQ